MKTGRMVHSENLESAMKLSRDVVAVLILLAGGAAQSRAGILHGSDISTSELLTISTSTGAGTSVGALGLDSVRGLATDPNTNTLYGSNLNFNTNAHELVTINTSTGAATPVGPLGLGAVNGLALDLNTNTLYGVDSETDQLLTINTSTGAGTPVGALGFDIVLGLAFVPEPSTLALAVFGFAALGAWGWQRRRQ